MGASTPKRESNTFSSSRASNSLCLKVVINKLKSIICSDVKFRK